MRLEATAREAQIDEIRASVRALCARYGEQYWLELDGTRGYPTEFVRELTTAGFLTALIPEEYGGAGLGVLEAAAIMEEISRSGAHAGACHAQMYVMGTILRTGSGEPSWSRFSGASWRSFGDKSEITSPSASFPCRPARPAIWR